MTEQPENQNIYDDPTFFAGYSTLDRSVEGLAGAAEWPSMQALLPSKLDRLSVLDLGCGFGWFCRWAREGGASDVLGLDLSERMLARAADDTDDPQIRYERADIATAALPQDAFDLVYSSLTLHYLAELGPLFSSVRSSLRHGGRFVFSVEHPIFTAPAQPGFTNQGHQTVWPLNDYLVEGPRRTSWFADDVLKYHRTVATYVSALLAAGFTLGALVEWGPNPQQLQDNPQWANEIHRPPFLLVSAHP